MNNRSIRRAALISPFGPGALSVNPDGTALITAGLDYWLEPPRGTDGDFNMDEFKFHEWRLERELQVGCFVLPPDSRAGGGKSPGNKKREVNVGLKIPFLRFPGWHVCTNSRCSRMEYVPLTMLDTPTCKECEKNGRPRTRMVQAQFVAVCENGHIQDFPWKEWVHETANPGCDGELSLSGTSGASLASRFVQCSCGKRRSLGGITNAIPSAPAGEDGETPAGDQKRRRDTFLTDHLSADGSKFTCMGLRPWLGEKTGVGCGLPLHGTLRGASNVYFGIVKSAIYLPRSSDLVPANLVQLLEEGAISGTIALFQDIDVEPTAKALKRKHPLLNKYTDDQLDEALAIALGNKVPESEALESDDPETAFRRDEFAALRREFSDEQLKVNVQALDDYGLQVKNRFQLVTLAEKLRETRAFAGFARIQVDENESLEKRKSMLWKKPPHGQDSWLPAYKVFGEGIYLELAENHLREWESKPQVANRVTLLSDRYAKLKNVRSLKQVDITPRFLLIHTLAHMLMNELVFDCGYSSASLRERIFVSTNKDAPMAGLLIYTAAGDSDGTLGGLVRMGKPGMLDQTLANAIANARWCSSDPVCMELGSSGGQGPDSCNLAACHSCALVPETSCEQFNKFLDRWTVVGDPENPELGFFGGAES